MFLLGAGGPLGVRLCCLCLNPTLMRTPSVRETYRLFDLISSLNGPTKLQSWLSRIQIYPALLTITFRSLMKWIGWRIRINMKARLCCTRRMAAQLTSLRLVTSVRHLGCVTVGTVTSRTKSALIPVHCLYVSSPSSRTASVALSVVNSHLIYISFILF